jgi:hypothetical protein
MKAEDKITTAMNAAGESLLEFGKALKAFPFCFVCGVTKNLTECQAIPDSTYHLCKKHLAEESE